MTQQTHWDDVYRRKEPGAVSWYAPRLSRSVDLIAGLGLPAEAAVIDVGGGASTLVIDLLELGLKRPWVLDISAEALAHARKQTGARAAEVEWRVGDVTTAPLPEATFDVWHDRAVFHFLTDAESRRRYVDQVSRSVKVGGHVIVATFGPDGPEQCSGLDVVRYSPDGLHAEFGRAFEKIASSRELHETPWGSEQEFIYCLCKVVA